MSRFRYSVFTYVFMVLFSLALAPALAAAEADANVQVILVKAGNTGKGIDGSLRPYASTLQRLFRFESYERASSRRVRLPAEGSESVSLAGGQTLELRRLGAAGRGVKADIEWRRGSKRLLHTRINLQAGRPAVLGGPRSKDDTWLLILVLQK